MADLLGDGARNLVLGACWRRLDAPDPVVAAAAVRCLRHTPPSGRPSQGDQQHCEREKMQL